MPSPSTIAMNEEHSSSVQYDRANTTVKQWLNHNLNRLLQTGHFSLEQHQYIGELIKTVASLQEIPSKPTGRDEVTEKILTDNLAACQKTLADQELAIAALKAKLAENEEHMHRTTHEHNEHYIATAQKVGTMALNESNLKGAMALLGRDLLDAQASRDRVLAENCNLTLANRELRSQLNGLNTVRQQIADLINQNPTYAELLRAMEKTEALASRARLYWEYLSGLTEVARAARIFLNANTVFVEADIPSDTQTDRAATASGELENLLSKYGF